MHPSNHFNLVEWTDYVRGVAPDRSEEMARHLAECLLCSLTVNLLRRVVETAQTDKLFEPPTDVVNEAIGIFPASTGVEWQVWAGLRRLVGGIEWHSSLQPAASGIRSLRVDSRHFIYRAGHYSVDLQVDKDPGVIMMSMTGQIADEAAPDIPVGNLRVVLLSGGKLLASTGANEFGEFFLQFEPAMDLKLLLPIEEAGEYIELQLDLPDELN